MFVYLGVLVIILLILFATKNNKSKIPWQLIVSFILIFLMMALRYNWSGDYWNYDDMFDSYHYNSWNEILQPDNGNIEIGYKVIMKLCESYREVIIVTSLIICSGLFFFFYQFIPQKWWPCAFLVLFLDQYLLPGNISGIRNALAVSIYIFALYFLMKGRWLFYIGIVFTASYFHKSVLFMLPFVLIRNHTINIKPTIFFTIFGIYLILCATFIGSIGSYIDAFIVQNSSFERYESYTEGINNATYGISLLYYITIPLFYFTIKAINIKGLDKKEYFLLFGLLLWFFLLFFPSIALKGRFYFYFDFLMLGGAMVVCNRLPKYRIQFITLLITYFIIDFIRYASTPHYALHWFNYFSII